MDHPLVLIFQDAACTKERPCLHEGWARGLGEGDLGPQNRDHHPRGQGCGTW